MDSINFLTIFDVVIFGYGWMIVAAAIKMKKTEVPASMLIPPEDLPGSKDPKGFCKAMYLETLIFGIICVAFGVISALGEYFIKIKAVTVGALVVFIVAVIVYCDRMRKARYKYIKS